MRSEEGHKFRHHLQSEYEEEIDLDGFDEEILNDLSTSFGDQEEITGSPELRLDELRLTLLCFVFSIKFFQMAFSAGFTLLAIQWDWMNDFMSEFYWSAGISGSVWATLFYCLKKVRFCRRFPVNLILLILITFAMAYTFAVLAIYIWPYPYMILVALATASSIFFLMIPAAIVFKVDENGYVIYKHIAASLLCVLVFAHIPYFVSIGPRYDVRYLDYLFNIGWGSVIGVLLCLEGFINFKRHMNSGRLTSLANLEGIFSASIS